MLSEIKDINISNVTATGVEIPIIIAGYKQFGITKRLENITLKNIFLDYYTCEETVDSAASFLSMQKRILRAGGLEIFRPMPFGAGIQRI